MNSKIRCFAAGVLALAGSGAFAAGLSATNYVQRGLFSHFDGVENVGVGQHNADSKTWTDLRGSGTLTRGSAATFGSRYLACNYQKQTVTGLKSIPNQPVTIDLAVHLVDIGNKSAKTGTIWPYMASFGNLSLHGTGDSARYFRFFVNSTDPRPNSWVIYTNTITVINDTASRRIYRDGTVNQTVTPTNEVRTTSTTWDLNSCGYTNGFIDTRFYGLRFYTNTLTQAEINQNSALDQLRFWAPRYTGDGSAANWGSLAWTGVEGEARTLVANGYAVVANAAVAVAKADSTTLNGLSLEDGATLNVASDAALGVKVLYVEGQPVTRGIYTGSDDATRGTKVAWLAGDGVVRVAGSLADTIPTTIPVAEADGWYQFGITKANGGKEENGNTGYDNANTRNYVHGSWPKWGEILFPQGAKLRLVGYYLLDQIPTGLFSEIDFSQSEYIMIHAQNSVYEDGTPFTIPAGVKARWQPGSGWKGRADTPDSWWLTEAGSGTYTGDLVVNGSLWCQYDNPHLSQQTFSGRISGSGLIMTSSFGNFARFRGLFAFNGTINCGSNGTGVWIDTTDMDGQMTKVKLLSCEGEWAGHRGYCNTGLFFGKHESDEKAANELYIQTFEGNSRVATASAKTPPAGVRIRSGGEIIVWGSNTVHAAKLTGGVHVMASRADQSCTQGHFGWASSKGIGFLTVDNLASGTIYGSTNVALTIGSAASGTGFDYTFQSNFVNRLTLDITNACNASTTLKATDLAMLPARVKGFKGKVTLTDAAERAYTIPFDFAAGPNGLCQTVGCDGSGELAAAPAAGSIDVTFPTGEGVAAPARGDYALARFTSGGEKLANWTVTFNGQAVRRVAFGNTMLSVRKDSTGIYLAARPTGTMVIVR